MLQTNASATGSNYAILFTTPSPVPTTLTGANVQYYNFAPYNTPNVVGSGGNNSGFTNVNGNATVVLPTTYLMGMSVYINSPGNLAATQSNVVYTYRSTITATIGQQNFGGYGTYMLVTN